MLLRSKPVEFSEEEYKDGIDVNSHLDVAEVPVEDQ
jgi:hypothetical protein